MSQLLLLDLVILSTQFLAINNKCLILIK
jgi:hypothetical protein